MRTKIVVLMLVCILFFEVIVNVVGWNDFKKIKNWQDQTDITVSIKNYRTGESIEISDLPTIQKLCNCLSVIKYKGPFFGKKYIDQNYQSYAIIVSSSSKMVVITVSEDPVVSNVKGSRFDYSICNYTDLFELLESFFIGDASEGFNAYRDVYE